MAKILSFNGVTFDPDTCEISGAVSAPYRVRRSVGRILVPLMEAAGRPVRRKTLVDAMWDGRDDGPMDSVLHVVIHRLRLDLAAIEAPMFIMNAWGFGYQLTTDRKKSPIIRCPHCGKPINWNPAQ